MPNTNSHIRHNVAFGLKISKSGTLYVLVTLLIGFAAVNTGNNLLFLVVSGLLAFMSVTGLAGMYNIKKLIPVLLPPEEIYAGLPAPFRLSVQNCKTLLPSFLISLECDTGQTIIFPVVPNNTTRSDTVLLTFNRRGSVPVGRITISSPYPVGFFRRYWSFDSSDTVIVFPSPIATAVSGSGEDSPATGTAIRRERGLSGELERIYPYSGSEPLRMIHWKHSARSPDFMVKGFGRSVATPLVIDLDLISGQGVEEKLSRAAWLVQRWVRERPVGMILGGRVLPAGTGRQHGLSLLKELALYDSD